MSAFDEDEPTARAHHLTVVSNNETTFLVPISSEGLPEFEGQKVLASAAKLSSLKETPLDGAWLKMDDTIKAVVALRVKGVYHKVAKNGDLVRLHDLEALEIAFVNWDVDVEGLQ